MSQQYSWPTHSWPLEGRCLYYALLGLTQAPGFAGGPDLLYTLRARECLYAYHNADCHHRIRIKYSTNPSPKEMTEFATLENPRSRR